MISRRTMLTATLAGIPVGVAGGLFAHSRLSDGASIRFLGRDKAMIAVLDTGNTRTMVLLGAPDPALLSNLAQLRTLGRARLDLLIGSHGWLTSPGLRTELDLNRITTISLQTHASLPPIRGKVLPVTTPQSLELGNQCEITIAFTGGISEEASNPGISRGIQCEEAQIALVSSADALGNQGPLALLAVPGRIEAATLQQISPSLFVGTELPEEYAGHVLLAHPTDPLMLGIDNGSVSS